MAHTEHEDISSGPEVSEMSCNCSLTNTRNTTSTLALVVKEPPKPTANEIIASLSQLASLLPMRVHAWTTSDGQLRASNMRNEAIQNIIGAIVHKSGTFSLSVYETDAAKPPEQRLPNTQSNDEREDEA